MSLTRGQFLLAAASSIVFRNETIHLLEKAGDIADADPEVAARDEQYWERVRHAFDVETDFLFLNNGGACPSPRTVQDAIEREIRRANRAPSYYLFRKQEHEIEPVRARIAHLFGCNPEEIALTPNASEGLFTGIMGVKATSSDSFVATDQDYPRVLTALAQRARRDRIQFLKATIPNTARTPEALISTITELIFDRPKLVVFPRIGFLDGGFFPAEKLCATARGKKVLTLIDGAHSIGQVEDSAEPLGCDMFACCLHKWILGPIGSGFLYVKTNVIPQVWPLHPADEGLDANIRKFEQFGTRPTGILLSVMEALEAHEAIGTARKAARIAYLRRCWTDKIRDIPKIRFHSKLDGDLSRCLTTVEVIGSDPATLANWLFSKHRIFVTTAIRGEIRGIRVSPQIYHTPTELDRLVNALRLAANEGLQ